MAEHDATPVNVGHTQPIRRRPVLQAGFGGNVPSRLHLLPTAQISLQITGEDDLLLTVLSALELLYFQEQYSVQ